ncbi:hypothetical protein CAEBREN_16500 [Caenorhabditis brenneri]|uniref:C-type lectin domain-containing protein n=1 Tax=Caenorhabditis brenneri TaxID=135651 RepID=G0P0T9_CAEBE|nr:hypothetical protein CAEBREN_16500 [Caenorhabditis brenneri]
MKRLILFLLFLKIHNVHGYCHQEIQSTEKVTNVTPTSTVPVTSTTVPTSATESTTTPVTTSSTTAQDTTTTEPTTTMSTTSTVPATTSTEVPITTSTVPSTTTVTTTVPTSSTSTTAQETTTTEPTTTPSSSTVTSTPATTTITSTVPTTTTTVSTTESTTETSSTVTTTETTSTTTEPTSSTTLSTSTVSTTEKSRCANGYPIECDHTCGCPVYTIDDAYLDRHGSYLTETKGYGLHMHSNLTWDGCVPKLVRCFDSDNWLTDWIYTLNPNTLVVNWTGGKVNDTYWPPLTCNNETQKWSNYFEDIKDVAGNLWTCIDAKGQNDTSTTIMP